jgi:hypothetical protein
MEKNEKKIAFFEKILQNFLKTIPDTQQTIYEEVSNLLTDFDIKGGKFVETDNYLELTQQVENILIDGVKASDYQIDVKDFLSEFDKIAELNRGVQLDINNVDIKELYKNFKPIKEVTIETAARALSPQGISAAGVELIKKTIVNNVFLGGTIKETRAFLKSQIVGNESNVGMLERHAGQIARDTLYGYDGTLNGLIRKEFNMPFIRYVGSLVADSRAQCIKWVKMRKLEVVKLETEIGWAFNNGSGMIIGTNPANFETYRGGYNCRHSAIPSLL